MPLSRTVLKRDAVAQTLGPPLGNRADPTQSILEALWAAVQRLEVAQAEHFRRVEGMFGSFTSASRVLPVPETAPPLAQPQPREQSIPRESGESEPPPQPPGP